MNNLQVLKTAWHAIGSDAGIWTLLFVIIIMSMVLAYHRDSVIAFGLSTMVLILWGTLGTHYMVRTFEWRYMVQRLYETPTLVEEYATTCPYIEEVCKDMEKRGK